MHVRDVRAKSIMVWAEETRGSRDLSLHHRQFRCRGKDLDTMQASLCHEGFRMPRLGVILE
jgi:hypothetical protein